jgi:hypothetical protein
MWALKPPLSEGRPELAAERGANRAHLVQNWDPRKLTWPPSEESLRERNSVQLSPIFSAAMKADCGISTLPNWRIRFLPSFCFSRSLRFLVTSPP